VRPAPDGWGSVLPGALRTRAVAALTRAVTGSDTNALVKSVVTDFSAAKGEAPLGTG